MMTLTIALPGKLSRTRTQAMTVPITMLISVTMAAWVTVSLSAAQVWSFWSTWK